MSQARTIRLRLIDPWLPASMVAVALLVAAALLAACGGGGKGNESASSDTPSDASAVAGSPTGSITPSANAGLVTPSAGTPISQEDLAARQHAAGVQGDFTGARLIIPSIGVNAPFVSLTVGTDGQMPDPQGPTEVAWYDFSAWSNMGGVPGVGGNSVFSGHVDYHDYGPAVFWRLRELGEGDTIEVQTQDGNTYTYAVQWNRSVDPNDAAWNDIVASTAQESVTLITCGGTWDGERREYDRREVVWAVRTS